MKEHSDVIENIRAALECSNDTALANKLQVSRAVVSAWKKNGVSKKILAKVSELTGRPIDSFKTQITTPNRKSQLEAEFEENAIREAMKPLVSHPRVNFHLKISDMYWEFYKAIQSALNGEVSKERISEIMEDVIATPPSARDPQTKEILLGLELLLFQRDCGRNIKSVEVSSKDGTYIEERRWEVKIKME